MNKSDIESMNYNQMIARVQEITDRLGNSGCSIDDMIVNVEEAVLLLERCRGILAKTGLQVTEALARLNTTEQP